MANQDWLIAKGVPLLNGSDYEISKIIIESYLMVVNEDIWLFVIYGERNELNIEANEIIMKGLSKPDVDKMRHCELAKEMLDRLQCLYGGERYTTQEEL